MTLARPKSRIVYLWSLRNAAADHAGRLIPYKGGRRYMKSPLEHLVELLEGSALGDHYMLQAVVSDDDEASPLDADKLADYGFRPRPGRPWLFPADLRVQGRPIVELLESVPSSYRRLPLRAPERADGKRAFEHRLLTRLNECRADLVLIDGLLIILDHLVRPESPYFRRIVNIHPGITRSDSPYQRRGAHATLDALHGARGLKVHNWDTLSTRPVAPVGLTGASFHYVDSGIDSGEVIVDVLNTPVDPEDTILELRWNNFQRSLFPALQRGLMSLAST